MNLAALALLPAALLLDRLLGEAPSRIHPVCLIGWLAVRVEALLRRGDGAASPSVRRSARMSAAGALACLMVLLPSTATAWGLVEAARWCGGPRAAWFMAAALIYVCLAPRSLDEHARRVAAPLARNDLESARRAVSMMVGRQTAALDAEGVARACVESVAENLTDGVLSTLFWAGAGLLAAGCAGAAALAVLHRSANVLDAMWGKKSEAYIRFGALAARLDDALNFVPARLSLPCIALAARAVPGLRHKDALRVGWAYRAAHESPNSAWSEAAFAGALGLKLGGPALYGAERVDHPWLGDGTPDARPIHILLALRLLWHATYAFTLCEVFVIGLFGSPL
ncbi:MAG: cobalamin biosynthesis protein CobD [Desulfovibrionaceae bacterium]|nr:cobalamin biosynthesis protein CobD [Desulfovibrionaceae bacterium]